VVDGWNIYAPKWCPVAVVDFPGVGDKSLKLMDMDPYDYAKAMRPFQPTEKKILSFKLFIEAISHHHIEIEVVSAEGDRLVLMKIDREVKLQSKNGRRTYAPVTALSLNRWIHVTIKLDTTSRRFDLLIDDKALLDRADFSHHSGTPERIVFQTGPYRLEDKVQKYKSGSASEPGWDEPDADEKVPPSTIFLKDFKAVSSEPMVLNPGDFRQYIDRFNAMEDEHIANTVPNARAFSWMEANVPWFECPDKTLVETYVYRWWTFRKHIKDTPDGRILTEFITPVKHGGRYNTISCALCHHVYEGRWLHDQGLLDEYVRFWLRSSNGGPQPHLFDYSSWLPDALFNRFRVNYNGYALVDLLPDLMQHYRHWETQRQLDDGLFWQYDVRDGMEESISGGRYDRNSRPTINSYMIANAQAIAEIATMAGQPDIARLYDQKATALRKLMLASLWDGNARFFKVRFENGQLSDAREAIGFIPWMFNIPRRVHAAAWEQVLDPEGFKAPWGFTTAEQRHPGFRSHGTGDCEWDGAIWPFATSQILMGMANLLHGNDSSVVSRQDYFDALLTYANAHQKNGRPYIGEYQDEQTGVWLKGDNPRSRYYNHSTFCDLVITGLVGLIPRSNNTVIVDPLVPDRIWDWFALDHVPYHQKVLTILWDRTGNKYGRGKGFSVFADNRLLTRSSALERIQANI